MNPRLGIWCGPEAIPVAEVKAMATRIDELGYSMLWVNEVFGRDPFALCAALGEVTSELVLATGIANIYNRHPGSMKQGANTVAELTGGRFILGLGVSSPQLVERARGTPYDKPLSHLRSYLDQYDASRYFSVEPADPVPVVLAALGPRMLELASHHGGALTYNVTPDHTAQARNLVGDAKLFVEQKVLLGTDADQARATGAQVLSFYRKAPGYRNMWGSLGFTDDDIDGMSPRFVDALVAWGDEETIRARIAEHIAAGADHVCIQVLHPEHGQAAVDDHALTLLAQL